VDQRSITMSTVVAPALPTLLVFTANAVNASRGELDGTWARAGAIVIHQHSSPGTMYHNLRMSFM
jgi:hypothetical protein